MTSPACYVAWYLLPSGYAVDVFDTESQPLDEYRAGNSPGCSAKFLPPGHRLAEPRAILRKFAKAEARDTARRFGLDPSKIIHDVDAETDARNALR